MGSKSNADAKRGAGGGGGGGEGRRRRLVNLAHPRQFRRQADSKTTPATQKKQDMTHHSLQCPSTEMRELPHIPKPSRPCPSRAGCCSVAALQMPASQPASQPAHSLGRPGM
ncbi:hypothetical protein BD289DRAFT_429164, partial [Coniella lustricola]